MSRLNSRFLYGSTFDPNANRAGSVFAQNPTGIAGQAASFAAAQQSQQQTQAQREADARAAAIAQQQQVAQEATAAQQRDERARAESLSEQQTRLEQARFEQQLALQEQQNREQLAFQSNQQQYQQQQSMAAKRAQQQAELAPIRQQEYSQYGGGSPIFTNDFNRSVSNYFDARLRGGYSGPTPTFTSLPAPTSKSASYGRGAAQGPITALSAFR
jgi:flagellar biosynthesis GTPase FlhF